VTATAAPEDPSQTRRLSVWAIAAATYATMIVARSGPAIAADQISAAFAIPAIALGALFGAQYFAYMALQLPSGAFADSVGPRWMFGAGALLGGLGTLLFATTHSYHVAVAGRIMVGVGDSFIYLNALRLIGDWFRPYQYATWVGLLGVAGGLGSIFATAPLALVLTHIGWRAGFSVVGAVLIVCAAVCMLWVRADPADVLPDHRHRTLRQALPSPRRTLSGFIAVARNAGIWPAFAAHAAMVGPSVAFFAAWGVPLLLQQYGLNRIGAGTFLLAAGLGGMIGGPLIAYASDRVGRRRPFVLACVAASVAAWIVLAALGGHPPLWLLFIIAAIGSLGASSTVLVFAIAREINPRDLTGIASGLVNVGGYLCGSILQVVMGHALDSHWEGAMHEGARVYTAAGFANAFSLLAALAALAALVALRVPETGRAAPRDAVPTPA
jgi:MFS family permease